MMHSGLLCPLHMKYESYFVGLLVVHKLIWHCLRGLSLSLADSGSAVRAVLISATDWACWCTPLGIIRTKEEKVRHEYCTRIIMWLVSLSHTTESRIKSTGHFYQNSHCHGTYINTYKRQRTFDVTTDHFYQNSHWREADINTYKGRRTSDLTCIITHQRLNEIPFLWQYQDPLSWNNF